MLRSGFHLSAVPFLRLLIALCLGVSTRFFNPISNPLLAIVLLFAVLVLLFLCRHLSFIYQSYWGALLLLAVAAFGYVRASLQTINFPLRSKQLYFAVLDDYPKEKEKTFQLVCQFLESNLKTIAYLPKLKEVSQAKPGDILFFNGLPELMENEGNPFEFDYCGYLHHQNIGYRIFLKENQFGFLQGCSLMNLQRRALIFRQKLIETLYRSGIGREEVHLIASISFGARDDVDRETIQSFTNTGVIHVLAVSGMNVGLIYVILDSLLRFLKSWRLGSHLHLSIVLAGIWAYALITGMSPSILRAATMFSFVLIGTALRRNSNIFNSLTVSAFLLIAYDPSMMRDAGFQLSYAAVLAIVLIQPTVFGLIRIKNSIFNKIWELLSVTIAAQFGTLPFTLYYFHQFPVYFWLANLVVIPLVTLILYLSFVVLFFSLLSGFVTKVLAFVLDLSVRLVLFFVNFTAQLPQSVVRGLYPTIFQLCLSTLLVLFLYRFFRGRKTLLLHICLILSIILAISFGCGIIERLRREEMVFFNIPGTRAVAITRGCSTLVLYDSCQMGRERLDYYMKPYYGARGIGHAEVFRLSDSLRVERTFVSICGRFIFFGGSRICILPSRLLEKRRMDPELCADLVWLSDIRSKPTERIFVPESNIVLFRSAVPAENVLQLAFRQRGIRVTRAVQLVRRISQFEGGNEMICRNFGQ